MSVSRETSRDGAGPLAIQARGITKVYGSGPQAFRALKGVALEVAAGELVMLAGPSGSGKTTLLSIVGCVLRPSGGELRLLGHDPTRWREGKLAAFRTHQIGFIFQGHNLIEGLSNLHNVSLMLTMQGVSARAASREAHALLERLGIEALAGRKPADISGGQRQRVAIARALAGRRPLLLADEPTASLEAQSGLIATETMRTLAREQGAAVVIVTHDARIFHLADRIVHLEDGLITSVDDDPGADALLKRDATA